MNSDSPDDGKPRLRRRFRDQAREELLEAAIHVFQRDGMKEARIDTIAAEAGVSVGTIYNLFGDRGGLVHAVLLRGRGEIFDRVRQYLEGTIDRPFGERLHTVVHLLIGQMRAHWPTLQMIVQAGGAATAPCAPGSPGVGQASSTIVREVHGLLSGLVRSGVESGALGPVDVHVATCALMGAIRNTIDVDLNLGLDAPSESRADAIVKLFLEGAARR